MTITLSTLVRFLSMLALCALSVACSPARSLMMQPTTAAIEADAQQATVVFLRPSSRPMDWSVAVWDQTKTLLGEADPGTHFVTRVPAGKHTFFAYLHRGSSMLEAELEAGKVYYVFLRIYGWGNFGVSAESLHPGRNEWASKDKWLKTRRLVAGAGGRSRVTPAAIQKWTEHALQHRTRMTPAQVAQRTVLRTHGQLR